MKKSIVQKMKAVLLEMRSFISSENNIKNIFNSLSQEELLFIVENKRYADNARYQNKNELSESLAEPELINTKIRQIKNFFEKEFEEGCLSFLISLLNDTKLLEQTYVWGAHVFDQTEESSIVFWEQACIISTLDNADAMCFASDTWEFYIFEPILEKLNETYPSDKQFDFEILTAGLKDVRTKVYEKLRYLDSQDDIVEVLSKQSVVNSDGIMPLFLLTLKRTEGMNLRNLNSVNNAGFSREFLYWFELYGILYEFKILYETFEYFGKYEFLRHFAIMKTYNTLCIKNSNKAQEFKYLTSTYQYNQALEILKK